MNGTFEVSTPIYSFLPLFALLAFVVLLFARRLSPKRSIICLWIITAVMAFDYAMYVKGLMDTIEFLKEFGVEGFIFEYIFEIIITSLPVAFLLITAIEMSKGLDDKFTRVMACLAVATVSLVNIGYIGAAVVTVSFVVLLRKKSSVKKNSWKIPVISYAALEFIGLIALIFLPKFFSTSPELVTQLLGIEYYYGIGVQTLILTLGWAILHTVCVYILSRKFIKDE